MVVEEDCAAFFGFDIFLGASLGSADSRERLAPSFTESLSALVVVLELRVESEGRSSPSSVPL